MAFTFRQIDNIRDFDMAIECLEQDYIPDLLEAFAQSPEGQGLLQSQPKDEQFLGDWVGNLVYFGYAYLEVTLPKMKVQDIENILLGLFPRKLSLVDPQDIDEIIPELIAFWQFVQRQYKQRHSQKILDFLQKVQPQFKEQMIDPKNFGIAKSFMMSGVAAGFDMTTQAGVEAFQAQYNQQLRKTGTPPSGFPALSNLAQPSDSGQNPLAAYPVPEDIPPEFVALLSQKLGFGPMPGFEHLPSDPDQLTMAIAQRIIDAGEVTLADAAATDSTRTERGVVDIFKQLQAEFLSQDDDEPQELAEPYVAQLEQQTISETEPGTILHDFQTLLTAIGEAGLPVSGKLNHISSVKTLFALNDQLRQPIQSALKRPQQKSFPNLHGLYLLLRATGIAELVQVGKQTYLKLNLEIFAVWQRLNATEQYLTLLEAWVIRGDGELLGESRDPFNEGTRVLRTWDLFRKNQKTTFRNYNEQQNLHYWPGLHNLALMQMFGWVEITTAKPAAGKGWRIKKIKPLPLGDAFVAALMLAYNSQEFTWASESDFSQPWGELQPYLQSYFTDWQHNLIPVKQAEHQTGTYIFKVTLGKIWRRIAASSERTLEDLASLIRRSVSFDSDHLDLFSFKDPMGRTVKIYHPYYDFHDGKSTDEVLVGDLPLQPGMIMTYLFDFGDNWQFSLVLEEIQPGKPKRNANKVLEKHGKAPEQYPNADR